MSKAALAVSVLLISSTTAVIIEALSNVLTNGTVTAEWTSGLNTSLDGPKISGLANDTSYDWWYFDVVSSSTNASTVVVIYNSGPDGFINTYYGGPLSASISGTFANGTQYDLSLPATGAIMDYDQDSISLDWEGTGFSFVGSSLSGPEASYIMSINSSDIGVQGTITWKSLAPAHYPCSLSRAGASEAIMPHVGWANAVPDATASVSLAFGDGTALRFDDGVGYHDKNWGDQPFVESASQWYWGHAHLGPYSLVWFDALDLAGQEYFSGFVAGNGSVSSASCAADAVVVRPWGANSTYPPTLTTGIMQGLGMQFGLGNGSVLVANVTTGTILVDMPGYKRARGTVEGGIAGGEQHVGTALFEEFALVA